MKKSAVVKNAMSHVLLTVIVVMRESAKMENVIIRIASGQESAKGKKNL